jgi:hypothetical protein
MTSPSIRALLGLDTAQFYSARREADFVMPSGIITSNRTRSGNKSPVTNALIKSAFTLTETLYVLRTFRKIILFSRSTFDGFGGFCDKVRW